MRNIIVKPGLTVIILSIGLISSVAHGEDNQGKRVPPPEAFAACVGKTEGAAISFTTRNETLSAVCRMFDGKLAAAPDRNRNNPGSNSGQMLPQLPVTNLR